MRVNPGLSLTLFQRSWPWWVHNLIKKWSPVVCFVNYLCNQPPPFKKFMSWTSTSIIHIAKFRIWTLFVGKHIIYNRRKPYCSMMTSRKTSFVSATWKRFLVITLLLLTCLYMLQVILFLRSICFCVFYKRIKIPSICNLPWSFFSKEKLKDTGIVWVKYFPCIYFAFHINSS